MTDDNELRVLLRAPELTLDPPAGLADRVRGTARRQRRRTRIASVASTAVVVAVLAVLAPTLLGAVDGLTNRTDQAASIHRDSRAPHATSDVVELRLINGATILTWFEGKQWCTLSTRHFEQRACQGPVNADHQRFSWILPATTPSLTVDDYYVVAGIVPPHAAKVEVHMTDGRFYDSDFADGTGFVRPVWSAHVDLRPGGVAYYAALDATGKEIARQPAG